MCIRDRVQRVATRAMIKPDTSMHEEARAASRAALAELREPADKDSELRARFTAARSRLQAAQETIVKLKADRELLEMRKKVGGRRWEKCLMALKDAEGERDRATTLEAEIENEAADAGVLLLGGPSDGPEIDIPPAVRRSGLLKDLSLERDFDFVKVLGGQHHRCPCILVRCKADGYQCVLKEVLLGDKAGLRSLEAEVAVRERLRGVPGVVPLEGNALGWAVSLITRVALSRLTPFKTLYCRRFLRAWHVPRAYSDTLFRRRHAPRLAERALAARMGG